MAAFADVITKEGLFGGPNGKFLKIPEIYSHAIVNVRYQNGNELSKTENFILKGGDTFGKDTVAAKSTYLFVTAICYLPTSNNVTVVVAPPVILEERLVNLDNPNIPSTHYQFKIAPFVPVPPTETLSSIIYEFYQHRDTNNRILYTSVITNNFTSYQNIPFSLTNGFTFTLRVKFRTVSGFESDWTIGRSIN